MPRDVALTVQVIDTALHRKSLPLIEGSGEASVVLWPGNGAQYRTMQILDLAPGDRTIDLSHVQDCVYYVRAGEGAVRNLASGEAQPLRQGSVVHIDGGDRYRIEAGGAGLGLVGGPVPADPALYESLAGQEVP
jgi:quercetin dioxygenase-like cupin family protein